MKRIWTTGDLARHVGISRRRALRLLRKLDTKHGGQLLIPSNGVNREFTFYVSTLARLEPEMVQVKQTTEEEILARLAELEEKIAEQVSNHRRIAKQVLRTGKAIEKAAGRWPS